MNCFSLNFKNWFKFVSQRISYIPTLYDYDMQTVVCPNFCAGVNDGSGCSVVFCKSVFESPLSI